MEITKGSNTRQILLKIYLWFPSYSIYCYYRAVTMFSESRNYYFNSPLVDVNNIRKQKYSKPYILL